jgi:hypothetical protein
MKLDDLELDLNTSCELINVIRFYADPTTYFAVALIDDPPSGEIMDDFDDTGPHLGMKPGMRARKMMYKLNDLANEEEKEMTRDGAMEVKQASEIEEQINILRNQVGNVAEWLSKLEARIEPILVTDFDNEKNIAEEGCRTTLGNEIRDIRLSVEGLKRQTQRLVDRVEL